jgi:peptidoglycan/xylan/chitin deacetylase (PgdA/CDA1 family)
MSRRTTHVMKAVLSTMHFSGADSMIAPLTRGIGAVFMLHQVRPGKPEKFGPSRISKVTPQFLDATLSQVRGAGFDVVSLDEAHFRLIEGEYRNSFVCFTFEDGYRDTLDYVYPIFRRHNLPFAVYVPTDYPDGHGDLWWLALERVIGRVAELSVKIDGAARRLSCSSPAEKDAAYHTLYRWLRSIGEADARAFVQELCARIAFDPAALCNELMMTWPEIRQLATDPLVSVGAHTRRHYALAKLGYAEARAEIEESVRRIERETAKPCRHFSFPYGDAESTGPREFAIARELGLKTAVTGREGLIHARHASEPTALPRVSLTGDYQKARYVKVLLSGAPFAFLNLMQPAGPT